MQVVVNNIKKIVVSSMVLLLVLVTLGEVAPAEKKWFPRAPRAANAAEPHWLYGPPTVWRHSLGEFRLSPDGGTTWTANLLTRDSVDFASVPVGDKAGEYISLKALACDSYNRAKYTLSSVTVAGAIAVDPTEWAPDGKWEDGSTGVRYYYTGEVCQYKEDTLAEAQAAAEELVTSMDPPELYETTVDVNISAGATTTLKLWLGVTLMFGAWYDEDHRFVGCAWGWRDNPFWLED